MSSKKYSGYKFSRVWTGTRAVTTYRYYSKGSVYKTHKRIG